MNTFQSIVILSFLFLITNLATAQKSIQSGSWFVNQSLPAYSLDKNNGERTMTIEVNFAVPFASQPQIVLSVTQIDTDKKSNTRYRVEAISISKDGFTLNVTTWADSKIFSISGYWIAQIQ